MTMSRIIIRQCIKDDKDEILNICYKTGFMGEDLTERNHFNDKILFGYLFCDYYPLYEPNNCFVALDSKNNKIVGYLLGTLNTSFQQKNFLLKMSGKIFTRIISTTIWKYPESFKNVVNFIKNLDIKDEPSDLYKSYPAHLHINILPQYQYFGIGSMLIDKFEDYIKQSNIKGIHLRTSNYNTKALPFYYKKGYKLIYQKEGSAWIGVNDYSNIILGKDL